jgi:hypothetical protein
VQQQQTNTKRTWHYFKQALWLDLQVDLEYTQRCPGSDGMMRSCGEHHFKQTLWPQVEYTQRCPGSDGMMCSCVWRALFKQTLWLGAGCNRLRAERAARTRRMHIHARCTAGPGPGHANRTQLLLLLLIANTSCSITSYFSYALPPPQLKVRKNTENKNRPKEKTSYANRKPREGNKKTAPWYIYHI